ncbi:MAG: hypothetical protein Q4B43_10975 [Bacteroidota bacterium]|nr:hypothetical protein [Bacteroidota bacterium]
MKNYLVMLLLTTFSIQLINAQEQANKSIVLQGNTGLDTLILFPLTNDINLKNNKHRVVYPILVINNLQVRDSNIINCFRNHFDRSKIKKITHLSKEKAEKRGFKNVPKDGVLDIIINKMYYLDFCCWEK